MNATLDDFGMSNHSESFNADPQAKQFVDFCGQRSYEFLDWGGFDLRNQGGGQHNSHTHWNQHISGFFFLKCSNKTSLPILHDPRPGAMMTKLPEKDMSKISYANPAVHYNVKPGTIVIIPGYTPHQYPVDLGLEPFRFVHWNIQAVSSVISKASSTEKKKENDPPKK